MNSYIIPALLIYIIFIFRYRWLPPLVSSLLVSIGDENQSPLWIKTVAGAGYLADIGLAPAKERRQAPIVVIVNKADLRAAARTPQCSWIWLSWFFSNKCNQNNFGYKIIETLENQGFPLIEKMRHRGFEPRTTWLKVKCSTDWANIPYKYNRINIVDKSLFLEHIIICKLKPIIYSVQSLLILY